MISKASPRRNVISGKRQHRWKWAIPVVLAVIIVALIGTIVWAATSKPVTVSVNVTEGTAIGVYSDYACTMPCSSVALGNKARGTSSGSLVFYLRNEGTVPITITYGVSGVITGLTFHDDASPSRPSVAVGAIETFEMSVDIGLLTDLGPTSFTITFDKA